MSLFVRASKLVITHSAGGSILFFLLENPKILFSQINFAPWGLGRGEPLSSSFAYLYCYGAIDHDLYGWPPGSSCLDSHVTYAKTERERERGRMKYLFLRRAITFYEIWYSPLCWSYKSYVYFYDLSNHHPGVKNKKRERGSHLHIRGGKKSKLIHHLVLIAHQLGIPHISHHFVTIPKKKLFTWRDLSRSLPPVESWRRSSFLTLRKEEEEEKTY